RDLGEPDDLAHVVMDGVDNDVGPETAAVLAYPPGFLLEATGRARHFERLLRLLGRAILGRVEARKVLADDLERLITLDALCAGVPARHTALGVEHVDGVIGDALDEKPELLLAAAQGFLGTFALGEIAGDLGEADVLAIRRADRIDHHMGPEAVPVATYAPAL